MQGAWFSRPDAAWQNACWCIDMPATWRQYDELRERMQAIAGEFGQDSIAWAEADTQFLAPRTS